MRPTYLIECSRHTLFWYLAIVTTLAAVSSCASALSHGNKLERGYPDKFDYEGIFKFFVRNNLRFVHFGHLNDFVTAVKHLREREVSQLSKGDIAKHVFSNIDHIIHFAEVVRPSGELCNTQHVIDLVMLYNKEMVTNSWMEIHFGSLFKQYISELGRLCKQRMGKVLALFEGQVHGDQRLSEEEQKNVARVREAYTLLCNFVQGSQANAFCLFDLGALKRFQVMKLDDMGVYHNHYLAFYKSLAEPKAASFSAITLDEGSWVVSALHESLELSYHKENDQLPVQPLHAACELLENVYEQSTQVVDILSQNEVFKMEERERFAKDPLVLKWLNIESVCSLIMRTTLEFDDEGNIAYPLIGIERVREKPRRKLEPFTSYKEETIHQIDFTSTYKEAFTFGARLGTSLNLIGSATADVTGDTLQVLLSPLRLVKNSILNLLLPWAVDWVKAVKFGAAAQRDYYVQAPMRDVGVALSEASQKLYELFNKDRFYV